MIEGLEFKEKDHSYTYDGEDVPSVTTICGILSSYIYKDNKNSDWLMKQAAEKGTRIHEMCEALDRGKEVAPLPEEAGYIEAYINFCKDYRPTWLSSETIVFRKDDWYAGRLDRYGYIGHEKCPLILDIKTNSTITQQHKTIYGLQLDMYLHAMDADVDRYILHLKKDGTYKLIKLEPCSELRKAVLLIYKELNKNLRRKKK